MRPRIKYEVDCHTDGECLELVNASCVVLGMGPLPAIGVEAGDDLDYVLANINARLDGLTSNASGENSFTNVGNGAQVWAGRNSRFVDQFRTLRAGLGTGITIQEKETEIGFSVDTDWLHDRVVDIVESMYPQQHSLPDNETMLSPISPLGVKTLSGTIGTELSEGVDGPEVNETVTQFNDGLATLESKVNEVVTQFNNGLATLESKVKAAGSKVDLKINAYEGTIKKLEDSTNTLDKKIGDTNEALMSTNSEVTKVQGQLKSLLTKRVPTLETKVEELGSEINTLGIKVNKEWKLKHQTVEETLSQLTSVVETLQNTIQEQDKTIRRLSNQLRTNGSVEMVHNDGILTLRYKGGATIGSFNLCEVTEGCISVQPRWVVTGKIGQSASRDTFVLDANGPYLFRQIVDINEKSPSYGQEKWVITASK